MEETFANDTSHEVNIQNTQRTYTTQYQKKKKSNEKVGREH